MHFVFFELADEFFVNVSPFQGKVTVGSAVAGHGYSQAKGFISIGKARARVRLYP